MIAKKPYSVQHNRFKHSGFGLEFDVLTRGGVIYANKS